MLYSKLGSIPKPETDGTDGWIEVEDPPVALEGKEVVWWYPPGWVVRDVKPEGEWNWSQSEGRWVESVNVNQTSETIVVNSGNTSEFYTQGNTSEITIII